MSERARVAGKIVGFAVLTASLAGVACAGLVGVEDVHLRTDAGTTDPIATDDGGAKEFPIPVTNELEVALGATHTCARKPDLTVKCWGDDGRGQLGAGGAVDAGTVATPQAVPGAADAAHVCAGQNHSCVVRSSGKVACWGDNQDGQLGNGQTDARSNVPVEVNGLTDARAVACGSNFSCALRANGGVACWGDGLVGQLGNGLKQRQPSPTAVANLVGAIAVVAGDLHACAIKSDGTLLCWGDSALGQLGTGDFDAKAVPSPVAALNSVAVVAAGSRSTCAAKTSGAVFCWGANEVGQLANGSATKEANPTPSAVKDLDAVALAAGRDHACAVRRGGAVACWGAGFLGQIGDGQTRPTPTTATSLPSAVSGVTNAVSVVTGGEHSCATTRAGSILCWGENTHGELGLGTTGGSRLSPDSVIGYP